MLLRAIWESATSLFMNYDHINHIIAWNLLEVVNGILLQFPAVLKFQFQFSGWKIKKKKKKKKKNNCQREDVYSGAEGINPADTDVFKTSLGRLEKVTTSYDQTRRR